MPVWFGTRGLPGGRSRAQGDPSAVGPPPAASSCLAAGFPGPAGWRLPDAAFFHCAPKSMVCRWRKR